MSYTKKQFDEEFGHTISDGKRCVVDLCTRTGSYRYRNAILLEVNTHGLYIAKSEAGALKAHSLSWGDVVCIEVTPIESLTDLDRLDELVSNEECVYTKKEAIRNIDSCHTIGVALIGLGNFGGAEAQVISLISLANAYAKAELISHKEQYSFLLIASDLRELMDTRRCKDF